MTAVKYQTLTDETAIVAMIRKAPTYEEGNSCLYRFEGEPQEFGRFVRQKTVHSSVPQGLHKPKEERKAPAVEP